MLRLTSVNHLHLNALVPVLGFRLGYFVAFYILPVQFYLLNLLI